MARSKRGNREAGTVSSGNPGSAKVVNVMPNPVEGEDEGTLDINFDAALEPAVRTYRPGGDDMISDDYSAPTPQPKQEEQPPATEETTEETPESPEWQKDQRFSGDPGKIYQSYRELEQKLSHQGKEVGEYRQMFDQFMKTQLQQAQPQPQATSGEPSPEDVEILNKMLGQPKQFLEQMRNEWYQGLQHMASQNQVVQMKNQNAQTLSDPNFSHWLTQNVPYQLAQEADRDPRALQFVLNQYEMTAKQAQTPAHAKQVAQEELVTKAKKVQAAAGVQASSKPAGEKIWSRREIMRLQLQSPDEYARLARPGGAIYEAYSSGRIKD